MVFRLTGKKWEPKAKFTAFGDSLSGADQANPPKKIQF